MEWTRNASSGTLYPLLMRRTDQGFVEAEWLEPAQPGLPACHAYRLEAAGVQAPLLSEANQSTVPLLAVLVLLLAALNQRIARLALERGWTRLTAAASRARQRQRRGR